jgi:hypothetical protein
VGECTRVWAVSTGSYSDYAIERVFSTRALAEAYKTSLAGRSIFKTDARVEAWDVDSEFDPDKTWFRVSIRDDSGEVWNTYDYEELPPGVSLVNFFERTPPPYAGIPDMWIGYVQARDRDHATKIAADLVAMAKAQEAGIG